MQLTVVHNPSSGAGEHRSDALVAAMRSAGHVVEYRLRSDPGLAAAIARPADAIVLAGGDGTVGKLLHLLVPRGLPIGILPLGSANNLARSLGIAGDVEQIAAGLRADAVTRLDVGTARGDWGERLFADSAGAGAVSQAMLAASSAEPPPGVDSLAHARACIRNRVLQARPGGLEVVADGRPLPADTLLAEATIISTLGPRLPVAPAADPSDGLLDLVHAGAGDRAELAEWLAAGAEGDPPVTVTRVRSVSFRRTAGMLRVGDAFEQGPGTGSVIEMTGTALSVLIA